MPGASTFAGALTAVPLFGNVPEARGFGAELTATYQVTNQVTMRGALGLLHTEITDAGPVLAALEGDELPRAPSVTGSFGLTYESDFGLDAGVSVQYIGNTISALDQADLASNTVVDLNAGYDFEIDAIGRFRTDAFITNLFDERYLTFTETTGAFTLQAAGRPRTFGLALTAEF